MVERIKQRILEGPAGCERPLEAEELLELAREVDLARLDLGGYERFREVCYARNTVLLNEHIELVVICWLPGQKSAVHDHGRSHCLYLVVAGRMREQLFRLDGAGEPRPSEQRRFERGAITIAEGATIHQITNPAPRNLVTVHIYSPPLGESMRLYTPIPTEREDV